MKYNENALLTVTDVSSELFRDFGNVSLVQLGMDLPKNLSKYTSKVIYTNQEYEYTG